MKVKKILCSILALCMVLSTMGTVAFASETVSVTTLEEFKSALDLSTAISVDADITIDEALTIPENVVVTVAADNTLRVLNTLTNNGTINGDGTVSIDVMEYVVETVYPFDGVSYDVTATQNGAIEVNTPECSVVYEISLDGGKTWFADTTNGKAQAVTETTDGTQVVYSSFQSAFTSAKTGEVVHMLKDAHVQSTNPKKNNGPLRSYYGLILEGNGHTIYTDLEASGASNEYATIKFTSYLAGTGPEVNPVLKNVTIDSQKNAKADLDFVSGDVTFSVAMYNVNLLGKCQYASFTMTSPSFIINKSNVEIYDCVIPSWDAGAAKAINIYSGNYAISLNSKSTVYGGTYSKDVTNYLAEGFMVVENGDGTYTVKPNPAYGKVAKVGDVYYETLDEALNTAVKDDVIEILNREDIELNEITKVDDETFKAGETEVITTDIDEGIEVTVPELISHVLESYDGTQGTYEVVVDHKKTSYDKAIATLDLDISLKHTYDGVTKDVVVADGKTFTVKVKLPGNAKLSPTPTVKHNGTEISGVEVIDGYVVFETDGFSPYTIDYQLLSVNAPAVMCEEAVVKFVVSEENENNTVYDIVIESTDGNEIFGLVSAQMDIKEAADMSGVNFLVEGANDFIVTNDADSYMFTLKSADNQALADTKSGESVKVGKLTISGFTTDPITWNVGTYTVNSVINSDDGAATSYLDTTVTPNETKNIHIALTGGNVTYEKDVPKQELTVEVTFPKAIEDNDYNYQDMKITVTEQDYGTVEEFVLGKNHADNVLIADDKYTVSVNLPKYKTYTVKIEGAGYRTFTKTVDLDADKTMIVWNNYKDNGALIIKDGETEPEAKATITFLAGDIVKDNTVNAYDLSVLLSYAFTENIDRNSASKYTQYDLNRDGLINYKDAAMILDTWVWGK